MAERIEVSRRNFLKISAALGGGLLIGIDVAACGRKEQQAPAINAAPPGVLAPNAWIRIAPDDNITLMVGSSEMGQGVMTAIPMLLAEELDADWSKVRAEAAPAHASYSNPINGRQHTGGSTSVRAFWQPLREAGAATRELLMQTAAQRWNVPLAECSTEPSVVIHKTSGRRLRYGELVEAAAKLPVPETAFLKEPKQFRFLGTPVPRLDTPAKLNGSAVFGQDVKVPGMLIAVVARCPVFGGKLKKFDASAAKKIAGVRHVLEIDAGVAVVADHFWAAQRGRDALKLQWNEGDAATLDSAQIRASFIAAVDGGKSARNDGDVAQALQAAAKKIEAVYEVPYLAHACMEPMNCTAHVRKDGCDVWVPTQGQTTAQHQIGRHTGLKPETIKVHTTFLGGGFGRRAEYDFVVEAVQISKQLRVPVKVIWTREDDMRHDRYRPATYNRMAAAIDSQGTLSAWQHRIAGPSIFARVNPPATKDGLDSSSLSNAQDIPYVIPNVAVSYALVNVGVPVGFWRSVGASQNVFVTECFFDEVARAAGKDPVALRRELLKNHPRLRAVLDLAAQKAGWDTAPAAGRARGIAVAESFASFVAQVAEVSIENGKVRVHRVVCAVDCGTVVNPNTVAAQMEGAIIFGLSAALKGEITLANGRVQQSNFNDYPLLRFDESPRIEVYIVPSTDPPGGVGEPGVPPIAPAVANAVHALTGTPVRKLPIRV